MIKARSGQTVAHVLFLQTPPPHPSVAYWAAALQFCADMGPRSKGHNLRAPDVHRQGALCLYICLSIYMSVYLCVCNLSVYPCVYISVYMSVYLSSGAMCPSSLAPSVMGCPLPKVSAGMLLFCVRIRATLLLSCVVQHHFMYSSVAHHTCV